MNKIEVLAQQMRVYMLKEMDISIEIILKGITNNQSESDSYVTIALEKYLEENGTSLTLLLNCGLSTLIDHIIRDRFLHNHFSIQDNISHSNNLMETNIQSIPIIETLEMLGLNKFSSSSRENDWKFSLLDLDYDGYAQILQEVVKIGEKSSTFTDQEKLILLYLQQVLLVLGNYPFHKLFMKTITTSTSDNKNAQNDFSKQENIVVPYLHPVMHVSVLRGIASDPLIENCFRHLESNQNLHIGKLFDELVRKCSLSQLQHKRTTLQNLKQDLYASMHELSNTNNFLQSTNTTLIHHLQ